MELFKTFRTNFALVGIVSNANPFESAKIKSSFLMNWLFSILSWTFLVCEANTFIEYTTAIYIASALTVVAISFTIVIFHIQNIFEFIGKCEKVVQTGKNRTMICIWNSSGNLLWQRVVWVFPLFSSTGVKIYVHQNGSSNREMESNCLYCDCTNDTSLFYISDVHLQFGRIFHYRFRNGCFWAATARMVCWKWYWFLNFVSSKINCVFVTKVSFWHEKSLWILDYCLYWIRTGDAWVFHYGKCVVIWNGSLFFRRYSNKRYQKTPDETQQMHENKNGNSKQNQEKSWQNESKLLEKSNQIAKFSLTFHSIALKYREVKYIQLFKMFKVVITDSTKCS